MARKKTDIQDTVKTQENVQDVQETVVEGPASEAASVEERLNSKAEAEAEAEAKMPQSGETPAFVDKLLKTYARYAVLYVDAKGGVYTEDAQPIVRGDAILYQNPYYKQ